MVTTLNNETSYISNIDYVGAHTVSTTGQKGNSFIINIPYTVIKTIDDRKCEIQLQERTNLSEE